MTTGPRGRAPCLTAAFLSGIARCLAGAGAALVLCTARAEAQKTDSVWIRNGDRITGEVKGMSRALLKYSTDDLGTISIEWTNVTRIYSPSTFEIQVSSGRKYYGSLRLAPNGRVLVGDNLLVLSEVVSLARIRRTFIARLDGYFDLGFSFQKAHKTLQVTSGTRVVYRGPATETALEASTFREDRDDADATNRLTADLTQRFLLSDWWSAGFGLGYERNEELDLAGRTTLVGFGAYTFARSNHFNFWTIDGLVVTREQYFSTDSTTYGLEGLIGAMFGAYRYDHPKLDASITSQLYPSLTVSGRIRWQNDLRLSYELLNDFMVTFTFFNTFDSKPQSVGAAKNDFGTTLAISWTF